MTTKADMHHTTEGPFPTHDQELLLIAALLPGQEGLDAWNEWKTRADLDGYLDQGSFRLLPLLYKTLVARKSSDPAMAKLKSVYRQSWYKNQKLLHCTATTILLLKGAGIRTMVLKGTSLGLLFYKDTGVRPMADFDLLVPCIDARATMDILRKEGWQPEFEAYIEYNLQYGRSMMFRSEEGFELDLHWHPFFEAQRDDADQAFWDAAIGMSVLEASTLSLSPSDMLLHTFVHGLRWNKEPPIRWVADAFYILQSKEYPINWEYFLAQVKRFKVVLQVREGMRYLSDVFRVQVPGEVMKDLGKMRVSLADKLVFREAQKDPEQVREGFIPRLYALFVTYVRQTNQPNLATQLPGFIRYLLFRTRGKNHFRIIWYYLTKGFRKGKDKREMAESENF